MEATITDADDPNMSDDTDGWDEVQVTQLPGEKIYSCGGDELHWAVGQTVDVHPKVETTVVMVHCDRYVDADTRGNYRQEHRVNL